MDQNQFNWVARIQEAVDDSYYTHVPPDITFKIEENGSVHTIDAHKVFMGLASRVFNKMFFVADTEDKNANELLVKGTTGQAFQIMKDAIYNTKLIQDSLNGKSVQEVFAVLDLLTRYEIPELVVSVQEYLANFPLTEDNVLDVAEDAMHYTETFGGEAQALLVKCAKFLKSILREAQSVFQFTADNEDRGDVVLKLHVLMADVPPSICSNCRHDPCLDGQVVDENGARVGLIVTNNIGVFSNYSLGTAKVLEIISPGLVKVESIKCSDNNEQFNGNAYCMKYSNGSFLLHSCKYQLDLV